MIKYPRVSKLLLEPPKATDLKKINSLYFKCRKINVECQKGREAIDIIRKRGDKWISNINIGKYLQHFFSFSLFYT